MVKGISRQVIVLQSPETKMFEQAIFILKDGSDTISDEDLLKEAERLIRQPSPRKKRKFNMSGPVWAFSGAVLTGIVWLLTSLC